MADSPPPALEVMPLGMLRLRLLTADQDEADLIAGELERRDADDHA